jgi:hypothetical protein
LAARALHHVQQGERVKVVAHVLTDVGPHGQKHALALVVARTILVWRAEIAGDDRAVDSTDDLAQGYLIRRPGQDVPASDSAL